MEKPSVEQIKEQLSDILKQVAETEHIENFEIDVQTEFDYGDGMVGQFYDGKVKNKNTGEITTVVIKKAPSWDFAFVNYNALFSNEDLFYRNWYTVIDKFQKDAGVSEPFDNFPKYFCGNLERKKEFIAMESLKPEGYVMHDKMEYLEEEQLERLFKVYAKFHALPYVLRKKDSEKFESITKGLIDVVTPMVPFIEQPMSLALSVGINALDTEEDKIVYEEIKDLGQNALKTLQTVSIYNGEHRTIIHGDCWSNNFLFKYSETGKLLDLKIIDFQQSRTGTLIWDLSYLLYSGASKKDFDKLDHYLQIYHKTFFEFAKELGASTDEIITFDELKNEWKEFGLFGAFMGIYLWQLKLVPKELLANMANNPNIGETDPAAAMEQMQKHFAMLQDAVHSNEKYRERSSAILRHAFEYGLINSEKIVRA